MNLPDAVNCTPKRNCTQVSNNFIRDETLSFKAKGILVFLKSYSKMPGADILKIINHSTDGESAIRSGVKELQRKEYLKIIKYRSNETKQYTGSFLIVTDEPGVFNIENHLKFLDNHQLIAEWR